MGISNIFFLFLVCGVTARAYRVLPGHQAPADAQLLESPLYGPLSGVAFHLIMISVSVPRAQRQALNDEALTKLLDSFETRTNRLKPLLENVFVLLSKKSPARSDIEMLQTDFDAIQSIFSQDNKSPQGLCGSLLLHVREGLQEAAGLHSAGVSRLESIPSVITDFITADYLPGAERVYNLNRKLNDFDYGKPHDDSFSDKLYSDWQKAHTGIQRSGEKILALIAKVKNSIPRIPAPDEQERLAAASYFMPKTQNWQTLQYRLNEAEKMATEVVHNMRPTKPKPGKVVQLNLAEVIFAFCV
ncbi:conserved hypothetical protein [Neospora caninum Liverpool]|uniref:Uncharacterized protein n=1 Tax=Neospora caninum (strain Liverpool) TaxID=572307 RepID=F0VE27_NEOCL|nr:conserved hypothetical protein [Neospora caninum Liverpool]CBZ51970.1 conserved hypothetical protein [Neospora caninum Liverpool]CEL65931.1 TPA: hypothetical protein BN1204_017620 [Neospora caninum Liverpool]|eukprot:XP_003882003.1 conserved hypothetical protein [Neospora caninum Liverpool]